MKCGIKTETQIRKQRKHKRDAETHITGRTILPVMIFYDQGYCCRDRSCAAGFRSISFFVFPAGRRLFQGVNILHQGITVIEGFGPGQGVIRDNTFVNIVEGTVQHSGQLLGT